MATLSPEELYRELDRLCRLDDFDAAIALADANWEALSARAPSPFDTETCRRTMLAHAARAQPGYYAQMSVWRIRAMNRALRLGWNASAIALTIPEAFRLFGQANNLDEGTPRVLLHLRTPHETFAVLEELATIEDDEPTDSPGPPPIPLRRLYWEKRGFFLMLNSEYTSALESYEHALEFVGDDVRGELKVHGGIALCRYLQAFELDDRVERERAASDMDIVAKRSNAAEQLEIERIARTNHAAMGLNDAEALTPFEAL